jgi:sulfofructosephosphate aldolase
MVAIDQRESLRAMLSPSNPADVPDAELVGFKHEVTLALSGHASAILFDRSYGLPAIEAIGTLAPSCGIIVAADVFEQTAGGPIRSVSVDRQAGSVARAVRASAMKLLVPWRTDQGAARRADLVAEFTDLCREFGMLSLVEAVVQDDGRRDPAWYGTEGILRAAEEMAGHDFDLYKAQVPTLGTGTPDEITRLSERLTVTIGRPWVVLSSGVLPERFGAGVEAACRGGASGFLAGRAIWTSALAADDRAAHLVDVSVPRLQRLLGVVDTLARPWQSARQVSAPS